MLPLSPGRVPTSDAELTTRLTEGLVQLLRPHVATHVRVSVAGATAEHVEAVRIDLSGAETDPVAAQVPGPGGTPVTVDRVDLQADPLTVRGVRLRMHGELHRVPAAWSRDDAGLLWLVPQDQDRSSGAAGGTEGEVTLAAQVADLEAGLLEIGRPLLAERGFTLTAVQLGVQATGSNQAEVHVQAQVRRGILRATVEGRGRAAVDEALVLTLSNLQVSSANPLVSVGLAVLSRHLHAWEGRRIELGGHLVGGVRLTQVAVRTSGDEVAVHAQVGE
ncbi:MAG TPA: hypothetical protein H9815_03880 [Candidatus Ruania gallistercoris]|uniref:Uncharacterized protein n=1 Tax=Candidatus Ruania gallistercoris TaxID=2838746 RepID=A0A9D2EC35_9MICO|nr:hypothetical protein [Candidatus Ruania gallistercoris]